MVVNGQGADVGSNEAILADAFHHVGQVGEHPVLIQVRAAGEVGVHDVGGFPGVDGGCQLGVHFVEGNGHHLELEAQLGGDVVHLRFQRLQLILVGVVVPDHDFLLFAGRGGGIRSSWGGLRLLSGRLGIAAAGCHGQSHQYGQHHSQQSFVHLCHFDRSFLVDDYKHLLRASRLWISRDTNEVPPQGDAPPCGAAEKK